MSSNKNNTEKSVINHFRSKDRDDNKSFEYLLHSQLHDYFVYHDLLQKKFTLFINVIDRSRIEYIENNTLVYCGILKQRQLLEGDKVTKIDGLDLNWNFLQENSLRVEESAESKGLHNDYKNGKIALSDIGFGELNAYFKNKVNEAQNHEETLLEFHLKKEGELKTDFSQYQTLSLPLIKFAQFEGVIHIVF